jgi:uncharacterized repeat protein (TIGR04076 family)
MHRHVATPRCRSKDGRRTRDERAAIYHRAGRVRPLTGQVLHPARKTRRAVSDRSREGQEEVALPKLRITVLERMHFPYLQRACARSGTFNVCSRFAGRGGYSKLARACPMDSCSWPWADIQRDGTMIRLGGAGDGLKHRGTWLSACTDEMKPVILLIEPVDEASD